MNIYFILKELSETLQSFLKVLFLSAQWKQTLLQTALVEGKYRSGASE